MKMLLMLILPVLVITSGCKDEDNNTPEFPSPEAKDIYDSLLSAYEQNSSEKLKSVIDNWSRVVKPVPGYELNDLERDVYAIFQEIYTPLNIDRLGGHEWGNDMYKDYNYVIVQNTIFYDFQFARDEPMNRDSVADFRPDVHFSGVKTLYLTEEYATAINVFLGSEYYPVGTGGIMNPAVPAEESSKRYQFLKQYLAIIPGHWGGYWHIETHPYVSLISFDEERNQAKVYFRVGYMFGDALLEKDGEEWTLISSEINAIE